MKIARSLRASAIAGALLLPAGLQAARADDAPRFPTRTMEQLSPEQKAVAEGVLKQSSAGLGGPYAMLITSPELLKRYLLMTEYLRQKTSLPKRLNEMAILLEARIWDAQYEWWAHEPLARKAGVPEAIIVAIRDGKRPASLQPDEAIVYDFVTELLHKRSLSDETFAKAKQILGEQQVVDLAAVTGFYVMVSSVIAAGRVGIPNGEPAPMPVLVK
ncbi:MAG TPA: carboxymuconolactone decarboxylase family protein [Pseudolabrys sp.]|jgi:4-carboxymuconolactone decarboxylase